jgi:uncharacterized Zn finger protein
VSRYEWRPYVPSAQRRLQAGKKIAKLRNSGRKLAPIAIAGRKIARTFWGSAWCENLEAYSDYTNRLPRGRTYLRNGSVVDLQIADGRISALVIGSDLYEVELRVKQLSVKKWKRIRSQCAGQIDSLVELLRGGISHAVMGIVTRSGEGLFPTPTEISLDCSCPDWATMCKHVAAVLYGVGARLDHEPEMLFALRGVDPTEMVGDAVEFTAARHTPGRGRVLEADDLSQVFGVNIEMDGVDTAGTPSPARRRRKKAGRKVSKQGTGKGAKATTKTTNRKVVKKRATKKSSAVRKKTAASRASPTASKKRPTKRRPPRGRPNS